MARQRELEENAVDGFVGIKRRKQRLDLVLRCRCRQAMLEAFHAGGEGRLALGPDIDRARRIVAD